MWEPSAGETGDRGVIDTKGRLFSEEKGVIEHVQCF
jgi:hypothetical protein